MKHFLMTLLAITAAMITFASCENFENTNRDTNMTLNQWSVLESYTYDAEADAYRIYGAVLVDGWNGEPYSLEYTIDGKPGRGASALYHLNNQETGAGTIEVPTGEGETTTMDIRIAPFDGNQPSGSQIVIGSYTVTNKPELAKKSCGMARFLFPLLEPGTHTFTATLTNGYGQSITTEKTFTIVRK